LALCQRPAQLNLIQEACRNIAPCEYHLGVSGPDTWVTERT
jgi:hypothetical protein